MKEIIFTENAPAPIGPYNQAIKFGNTLYVSGQIALHPQTGELINKNIAEETHQVMMNLKAVLAAANMNTSHILKTTIFLKNMQNFAEINTIYGSYFEGNFPARETVEVARLPKDVEVEISCIAATL